ncbi:MAG TPA: 2-C-methyl-D-erythritol 4-phosphate cytidylyltransferase [Myxococcota bacterium]|jgi:2-C-methyl-D-erythritol 4-phosphate cytidylyltransferase
MLGLIVITADTGAGLAPHGLLDALLGAPLLARGIAAALPGDEAVAGVLVVPAELVDRVKADVVDRFGLDEIDRVVAGGPDRRSALKAGLDALPPDVDFVLVHEGARILVPAGLADRVAAAARTGDAAVPVGVLKEAAVADDGGTLMPLDVRPRLRILQGPQCFKATALKSAISSWADQTTSDGIERTEAELVAQGGASVVLVAGDDDNILLKDSADVSRALEVFSRRAVDYAFLYPRDLLPEDPLAKALDPGEPRDVDGAVASPKDSTVNSGAPVETGSGG